MEKTCTRCKQAQPLDLQHFRFLKKKGRWDSWCRACYRERSRIWNATNPELRRSRDQAYRERTLENRRAYSQKYGKEYNKREAVKAWRRKHHQALKLEALNAYGGPTCVCCGENTVEMMTLDHINSDGKKQRQELRGQHAGASFYRWLRYNDYPPGLQVLCMNCNWARHWSPTKECPHQLACQRLIGLSEALPAHQAA